MSYPLHVVENNTNLVIYYPNDHDHQYSYVKRYGRLFEYHYLDYIRYVGRQNNFKTAYDIGVCFANHSIYFGAVMGAKVLCFEPNSELHDLIELSLKENDVDHQLFKVALSDKPSTGSMAVCETNIGASKVVEDGENSIVIESLDRLVDSNKLSIPDFIKIDTEGFELSILKGATKLLEDHKPELFIEIDPVNHDQVFELLEAMGYESLVRIGKNYHFSVNPSWVTKLKYRFKCNKELGKLFNKK